MLFFHSKRNGHPVNIYLSVFITLLGFLIQNCKIGPVIPETVSGCNVTITMNKSIYGADSVSQSIQAIFTNVGSTYIENNKCHIRVDGLDMVRIHADENTATFNIASDRLAILPDSLYVFVAALDNGLTVETSTDSLRTLRFI